MSVPEIIISILNSSRLMFFKTGLLSQPDERKNNFDSLFYRIPT